MEGIARPRILGTLLWGTQAAPCCHWEAERGHLLLPCCGRQGKGRKTAPTFLSPTLCVGGGNGKMVLDPPTRPWGCRKMVPSSSPVRSHCSLSCTPPAPRHMVRVRGQGHGGRRLSPNRRMEGDSRLPVGQPWDLGFFPRQIVMSLLGSWEEDGWAWGNRALQQPSTTGVLCDCLGLWMDQP